MNTKFKTMKKELNTIHISIILNAYRDGELSLGQACKLLELKSDRWVITLPDWLRSMFGTPEPELKPDVINLKEYEKDLLYRREYALPLIPIRPWPNNVGKRWSDAELQYMEDNREEARTIRNRIFPDEPPMV